MKRIIFMLTLIMSGLTVSAQTAEEAAKYFKFDGGAQKIDKKILKEPRKTAVVYVAVKFNTGIMYHEAKGDKAFSKSRVDAYSWAFLSGLTDADFQEITNDFQTYLEGKLVASGFPTVDWSEIEANESYKKDSEKTEERNVKLKDGSSYSIFTGQNRPYYKTGTAPSTKMSRALKANVAAFAVEVNFADLGLDIEKSYTESSWEDAAYAYKERKLKFSAESNIVPILKLQPNADVVANISKVDLFSDYLPVQGSLKRPILSNAEFVSEISKEDVADKKESTGSKLLRAINPDMTGIASTNTDAYTVKVNADQYKTAVQELLHKYADYLAVTFSSYKK